MSKGSAPSAPDPQAAADAQIRVNQQTLDQLTQANRSNQIGPLGSQQWAKDPTTGQWTQTTSLSPQINDQLQQQIVNNDIGLGTQGNAMARLLYANYAGSPLSLQGLPSQMTAANLPRGQMVEGIDTGVLPGMQTSVSQYNPLTQLDKSGVPALQTGGISGAADPASLKSAQDAVYGQMTSRLDPQWNQQEEQYKSQLADQGIPQNSEAWNRAMDDFNRQKTDAYQTANNAAVSAGNQLQQQLYGQRLSSGQFSNSAEDQAFQHALSSGNFSNASLAQLFGQGLQAGQFGNSAQNQAFQQLLSQAGFTNSAIGQDFGQALQAGQFGNQARQQALGDLMTQRQEPINEVNMLKGGQVMSPQFGATDQVAGPAGAPNMGQLFSNQYQGQLNAYNAQVGQQNKTMGTVGDMLMAALPFII